MSGTKPCPACAEPIAAAAIKCRWCGESWPSAAPSNDEEHLRLLSIFHYVSASLTAFFSCIPLFHVAVGLFLLAAPAVPSEASSDPRPPAWLGFTVVLLGSLLVLAGWTVAILKFAAGRCLARRRRRTLCMAVACLSCLFPPLGTALGVFTLVVLQRPSVRALFEREAARSA